MNPKQRSDKASWWAEERAYQERIRAILEAKEQVVLAAKIWYRPSGEAAVTRTEILFEAVKKLMELEESEEMAQ